jgi:oligopeptidase B
MSSNPTRSAPALTIPSGRGIAYVPVEHRPAAAEPQAIVDPEVTNIHGESRIDEYAWMRHRDDPRVMAYLQAENAYTEAVMRPTEELQERLYREMRGRIRETDLSVPEREDGWLYYTRTETGSQYPIYCRRRDEAGSPEEVLLDQNPLAAGHAYYRLGAFDVSPDHRLLAYSVDTSGAEAFTLVVKDLETGELLPDRIENTSPSVAWANDSRTLFYIVLDQARRPCRLYRHTLGADPARDPLVHYEPDRKSVV